MKAAAGYHLLEVQWKQPRWRLHPACSAEASAWPSSLQPFPSWAAASASQCQPVHAHCRVSSRAVWSVVTRLCCFLPLCASIDCCVVVLTAFWQTHQSRRVDHAQLITVATCLSSMCCSLPIPNCGYSFRFWIAFSSWWFASTELWLTE